MNSLCVNSSGRVVTVNKDGIGKTSSFGPCNVDNERGPVAEPQPIVTVGLHGVHPLGTQQPTQAPWTSVRVESYSDWGAVFSYASGGSKMQITAASGSPFLWIERVSGAQPFEIVAGSTEPHGAMSV